MKGHSYIQSNILGALALTQLKKLDWMNQKRREHARYLNEGLQGIPGIEIPYQAEEVDSNWAIYAIRVLNGKLLPVRDALRSEGIECNTHYHPLHINSYYKNMTHCREEDFPNANKVYSTLLRLPMYPQLTRQDLDDIIQAIKKVMNLLMRSRISPPCTAN
jgi:dTDP-4-amino-4,6-dideoxygalactose transaminase